VDTLLCAALIEARSCERLGLLSQALPDPGLVRFYAALHEAEARHHAVYVDLACTVSGREDVAPRLAALAAHEARVLAALPVAPRLHGGVATAPGASR
jgi:tRNA-(ms[2]io[6]A)-hydroxylase